MITGVIGLGFYVVQHSSLGASMCGSAATERAPRVAGALCPVATQRVTTRDAQAFVDTVFAHADGSQREDAVWDLVVHDDLTRQDVSADWQRVLRVERLAGVTRLPDRNTFQVPVRMYVVPAEAIASPTFYTATLDVYRRELTVTLRHTDSGVRATGLTFGDNDPAGRIRPQRRVAAVTSDFYDDPVRRKDASDNVPAGSRIYEVCQLQTTGQPDTWWAWTYLGWVPHADLAPGDVELPGVPTCVYHADAG